MSHVSILNFFFSFLFFLFFCFFFVFCFFFFLFSEFFSSFTHYPSISISSPLLHPPPSHSSSSSTHHHHSIVHLIHHYQLHHLHCTHTGIETKRHIFAAHIQPTITTSPSSAIKHIHIAIIIIFIFIFHIPSSLSPSIITFIFKHIIDHTLSSIKLAEDRCVREVVVEVAVGGVCGRRRKKMER